MADDQGEIAWSHVLRQHADKAATEGFFRGFYAPLTGAANAIDDLSLAWCWTPRRASAWT